jgi:hypothetical protein
MTPIRDSLVLASLSLLVLSISALHREARSESAAPPSFLAAAAPESVSLDGLRSSLRQTDAIGFTTKLSLKHELDSLLDSFAAYHRGRGEETLVQLRERFADLLSSTLSLLRDDDPQLFQTLWDAQGELWRLVSDPAKFEAAVHLEDGGQGASRR